MASINGMTTEEGDASLTQEEDNTEKTSHSISSDSRAVNEQQRSSSQRVAMPSTSSVENKNNLDDVPINDSSKQSTVPVDLHVKADAPSSENSPRKKSEPNIAKSAKSTKKLPLKTPKKSIKSPQSQTPDPSDFGPFVNPAATAEWNPFDGDTAPSNLFQIADDDDGNNLNTTNVTDSVAEEELNRLRMIFDSEYEKALQDQEISWKARYTATRLSFVISAMLMISYLWLGCFFYRSEAGWSIADSLLFTVYTVTTVGYGGPQPLPNTASFHAFTSVYILVGISGVTILGAHTYQLITLEATRIRSSPLKQNRQTQGGQSNGDAFESEVDHDSALSREMARRKAQFMTELDDLVRQQPYFSAALDYCIDRFNEIRTYFKTTRSGKILFVALPFTGMILFGALVVGLIEGWTPLESIYWSIVTLTTVGYGDYVPTKNSSVWFCTVFFIPSSLFFLSFLLAQVAKSYIHFHASFVVRWERRLRRKSFQMRAKAKRSEEAQQNAESTSNGMEHASSENIKVSTSPDEENNRFATISYSEEEEEGDTNVFSFGDQAANLPSTPKGGLSSQLSSEHAPAMKYRESVVMNKLATPDPQGKRAVSFAEALRSFKRSSTSMSGDTTSESIGGTRPSLGVRLRVQERLAKVIAVEVAGYQTGVIIKGYTVSVTIASLHDTADKWKIPPRAWKAFRAVAFRSLLFVGERDLISDGVDALLRLNVMEFHGIFSPILAVMGDGNDMEAWLAATDLLADVELQSNEDRRQGSGKIKPVFKGAFA